MPASPALVTRWTSYLDVSGAAREVAWEDLFVLLSEPTAYQGDDAHPGWSPVSCHPPTRRDDHVTSLSALVLDYDGTATIEQARDMWHRYCGCLHTTRKHSEASHRFRVVLALSRRVIPSEHPTLWRWANAKVVESGASLDASTRNPSRFWYLPSRVTSNSPFEFHRFHGEPVDVDLVLRVHAEAVAPSTVNLAPKGVPVTLRIRRASHYVAKMDPSISGAGGHLQAWRVALVLTRGFDLTEVVALDLFSREYNPRCQPPWSPRECAHKISSAMDDARVPCGYLLDVERPGYEWPDYHSRLKPAEEAVDQSSVAAHDAYETEERIAIECEVSEPSKPPAAVEPPTELPPEPRKRHFQILTAADIFAPLPPIPWLVQGLDLTAGAPAMFAGYGYSRKTVAAQSLAIATAAGRRIWGEFNGKRGRVLHIDYEQGSRLSRERYIRLGLGHEIYPPDVDGSLDLVCLPTVYLDGPKASDIYSFEFDGYDLVLVDSFRAAAPSADENASDVRRHLDVLMRASERTGAVPIVIHHAGKPSADKRGDGRMTLRGSSSIFDGCSSVFTFTAEGKETPTKVEHVKARVSGMLAPTFYLDTIDTTVLGVARAGLQVNFKTVEQVESEGGVDHATNDFEKVKEQILFVLRAEGQLASFNALDARVRGARRQVKLQALAELLDDGYVVSLHPDRKGGPYRMK